MVVWNSTVGCSRKSTIEVIQKFQNKVLRNIVKAPWYIRNSDLHRDLQMDTVKEMIVSCNKTYPATFRPWKWRNKSISKRKRGWQTMFVHSKEKTIWTFSVIYFNFLIIMSIVYMEWKNLFFSVKYFTKIVNLNYYWWIWWIIVIGFD